MTKTYSLPTELGPILREGLLATDLLALHRKDANAALIAAIVSAQHAVALGPDVGAHVRVQLLALAGEWNRRSDASEDEIERAANVFVSAAFYLLGTEIRSDDNRFQRVAELLYQLVQMWPAIVNRCQFLVDRLVEGLPNPDSRFFWQVQVKLRSVR